MPRLAVYACCTCVLALAAAGMAFARGQWAGIVWVLLAGFSSNVAWFYLRRDRAEGRAPGRPAAAGPQPAAGAASCGSGAACGLCLKKTC